MRRAIRVFGCTLEDGNQITTDDSGVVSVTVHPNKSVTYLTPTGDSVSVDGKWVSYVPRFN